MLQLNSEKRKDSTIYYRIKTTLIPVHLPPKNNQQWPQRFFCSMEILLSPFLLPALAGCRIRILPYRVLLFLVYMHIIRQEIISNILTNIINYLLFHKVRNSCDGYELDNKLKSLLWKEQTSRRGVERACYLLSRCIFP